MNKLLNIFFWTVIVLVLCLIVLKLFTGTLNEGMESEATAGTLTVKVKYNSTTLSNRKGFGYRVPYEIVWRTGANEVTEISFSEDCIFGGKKVKRGTYSLWSIPHENQAWEVILNKEYGQYGTNYDASKDYVHVNATKKELEEEQESLRINVVNVSPKELSLFIRWETTELVVPISTRSL